MAAEKTTRRLVKKEDRAMGERAEGKRYGEPQRETRETMKMQSQKRAEGVPAHNDLRYLGPKAWPSVRVEFEPNGSYPHEV